MRSSDGRNKVRYFNSGCAQFRLSRDAKWCCLDSISTAFSNEKLSADLDVKLKRQPWLRCDRRSGQNLTNRIRKPNRHGLSVVV